MAFKYGTTSPTVINYGGTSLTVLQYGINGYDVLDYIEATGTQWIQTNLLSSNFSSKIIKCEIGIMPTSGSGARAYSTWIGCQNNLQYLLRSDYGKLCVYTGGNINYPITMSDNNIYDMTFTANYNSNSVNFVVNGSSYNYSTTAWGTNSIGIMLFASHAGGSPWDAELGLGRLYYCRFYDNNNLIRDFIPARRKSDNVVGLYDKLNNVFYTNSGSGSFVAGNDINGYPVWGKPYTLTLSAGSNTSISVIRTSSPNQHASTGLLSSGSVIYHGDTLTISYSVSSGYNISTHTINGTTFTSGTSHTVTGTVTVVTSAISSVSWHTMWSGRKVLDTGYDTTTKTFKGFSGLLASTDGSKIRITGKLYYYNELGNYGTWYSFTMLGNQYATCRYSSLSVVNSEPSPGAVVYFHVNSITNSTTISAKLTGISDDEEYMDAVEINKIEQYY